MMVLGAWSASGVWHGLLQHFNTVASRYQPRKTSEPRRFCDAVLLVTRK
jgi:hypothetical protein